MSELNGKIINILNADQKLYDELALHLNQVLADIASAKKGLENDNELYNKVDSAIRFEYENLLEDVESLERDIKGFQDVLKL